MTVAVSGESITFNDNSVQATAPKVGMVNRIINGAMVIDQRNAGASVTITNSGPYTVDRFLANKDTSGATVTAQRSTTAPVGFINSLLWTTSTGSTQGVDDDNFISQKVEGFNIADFAWGTANAATVTLSFWVRSSVTGTYGVALRNNGGARSYVASYTVTAANTFEFKTITIAGDQSGTWLTNNGVGIFMDWDLGCGTNRSTTAGTWQSGSYPGLTGGVKLVQTTGATFYITGVQLEKGSTATSFDYRPYGTEMLLAQRYYQKSYELTTALGVATTTGMVGGALGLSTIGGSMASPFPVQMRTAPTMTFWDSAGNASKVSGTANGTTMTTNLSSSPNGPFNISQNNFWITGNGTSTYAIFFHFAATAEL